MPKKLRELKIEEVSSVDRGAGSGCRVLIAKRDTDVTDKLDMAFAALHESVASIIGDKSLDTDKRLDLLDETIAQAESFIVDKLLHAEADRKPASDLHTPARATKGSPPMQPETETITKDEIYDQIKTRALAQKREGDTEAQAFSRYITEEPEGRALYTALKRSQGTIENAGPRSVTTKSEPAPTPSLVALNALAAQLRKSDPKLTEAQAVAKIYSDPKHRALAVAVKAEHRARALKALDVPSGYSGHPDDVNDNGEDDDGLLALFERFKWTPDSQLLSEIRNWSAQNAVAPPTLGVGKGRVIPSDRLASARLSQKASALAMMTGDSHSNCLQRVRDANPLLASAADKEQAVA